MMRRWIRIITTLVRTSMMTTMQYRADFLFHAVTGVLRTVVTVAPLWLVFRHTDAIGGWSGPEAMTVMAFFLLLHAVQGGVLEPNLGEVVESIRDGRLDLWLLKPVDAQWLVSVRKVDPAYAGDAVAAVALLAAAVAPQPPATAGDYVIAAYLLGCGLTAMYGLWLLATCTSFYWVRVDNLRYLLMSAADAGRWPVNVFGTVLRIVLTVVVPVAWVTTFPADALRSRWGWPLVTAATAVALTFALGSRWAWKRSLAHYTSASS